MELLQGFGCDTNRKQLLLLSCGQYGQHFLIKTREQGTEECKIFWREKQRVAARLSGTMESCCQEKRWAWSFKPVLVLGPACFPSRKSCSICFNSLCGHEISPVISKLLNNKRPFVASVGFTKCLPRLLISRNQSSVMSQSVDFQNTSPRSVATPPARCWLRPVGQPCFCLLKSVFSRRP